MVDCQTERITVYINKVISLGSQPEFPIVKILAIFFIYLIVHTKFPVNWSYGSGAVQFSKWWPSQPSWISDQNNFSLFFNLQITSILPKKFESTGLSVKEKNLEKDFQVFW